MSNNKKTTIALFKRQLLPGTETFIRTQQDAYKKYRVIAIGSQKIESSIARDTDILLYDDNRIVSKVKAKILSALGYSKELENKLNEESVKLVHAHFAPEGFSVKNICKKLNIPLIVTFHGNDIHTAPHAAGIRGLRYRLRLKKLFKDAQYFFAVSNVLRERAIALGCPPDKISVQYTGIPEVSSLKNKVQQQWDVLFVGRLIPIKGADHMLIAASKAEKILGKKLKIAIIGSGPDLEKLQRLAQNLDLKVKFLGHQPSENVQIHLASSKIFCAPSLGVNKFTIEAFGMVYLEAALQETPVVGYAFGGVEEAVAHEKSGLLVEEGNIDLLSEAIVKLLQNSILANELGKKGRQRALEDFSVAQSIESIETIYSKLIYS